MLFYYAIFLVLMLLCVGRPNTEQIRLIIGCWLLFLVAALRAAGIDNDYIGYLEYYNDVLYKDFGNVEFSFIFIAQFVERFLGDPVWLFAIYALFGVLLKYLAINRLSEHKMLSLLIYYAGFFPLWEMTQIRVAVAGGLMLLSIPYLVQRKYAHYAAFTLLAVVFHFSALAMLLIVGIRGESINKLTYAVAVPIFAVLALLHADLITFGAALIPFELVALKIGTYQTYVDAGDKVFNVIWLSRCALAYFLLFKADLMSQSSRYFIPLLKIYFIGLMVHLAFSSIPGVASRLSEFFLVVEFLLVPMMIASFRERVFGVLACILIASVFLAFNHNHYLKPYQVAGYWHL